MNPATQSLKSQPIMDIMPSSLLPKTTPPAQTNPIASLVSATSVQSAVAMPQPTVVEPTVTPTVTQPLQQVANPIVEPKLTQPLSSALNPDDKELDSIIEQVKVADSTPNQQPKTSRLGSLAKLRAPAVKIARPKLKLLRDHPHFLVMTLAVVVTAVLAGAAFAAFSRGSVHSSTQQSFVGTSDTSTGAIKAAGGSLISGSELDNLANHAADQLNSINDNQDFSADALSDHTLGL